MESAAWNWVLAFASVFATALLVVAARAYRRTRTARFLLLTGAFAFFAAKSFALSVGVNAWGVVPDLFLIAQGADVAILGLFYFALNA